MKNTQVDVSELIGAHNIDIEQFGAQISSKCARAYHFGKFKEKKVDDLHTFDRAKPI